MLVVSVCVQLHGDYDADSSRRHKKIFLYLFLFLFFFFKQKTAYEMLRSLVGSEMCIRDRPKPTCKTWSFETYAWWCSLYIQGEFRTKQSRKAYKRFIRKTRHCDCCKQVSERWRHHCDRYRFNHVPVSYTHLTLPTIYSV